MPTSKMKANYALVVVPTRTFWENKANQRFTGNPARDPYPPRSQPSPYFALRAKGLFQLADI